jgi:ABC-type Fe3+ transport system substrate-binding protein
MRIRSRGLLVVVFAMVFGLIVAACGADPTATPKPTPTKAAAATATPTSAPSEFELMVERARASNHTVRAALGFHPDETVKALEKGFEERWGFPLKLESEPGHPNRDMPAKITAAGETGKGVLDWGPTGTTVLAFPLLEAGLLRKPQWDVLAEEWPEMDRMRKELPDWSSDKMAAGETLRDYCALRGHSTWVMNYNPRNVSAEEIANLKYDDLLAPKWSGRVVMDERALGLYQFPLAPGWSEERLSAWSHNLGANNLKIQPGGSRGVHQAILNGEGDIGLGSPAWTQVQSGQPIAFTVAEFTTGANPSVSCLPKYSVNDPDMAELFYGWEKFEGNKYAAQKPTNYTFAVMLDGHASKYPLAAALSKAGLTADQLVYPRSVAENKATAGWRQVAIDGQLAGMRSGTTVPYNY